MSKKGTHKVTHNSWWVAGIKELSHPLTLHLLHTHWFDKFDVTLLTHVNTIQDLHILSHVHMKNQVSVSFVGK